MTLNPDQFLFHGTAMPIKGSRILPAKVHGKGSYWGDTGSNRGEPSEGHAWAHPSENTTWEFAHDRANYHIANGAMNGEDHPIAPRPRVYALHQNPKQTPGSDIDGEFKAPHFDIAHAVDTMPGRQGTFPSVNWNEHVKSTSYLPGDEDANHPSDLSVQFGHRAGVHAYADDEDSHARVLAPLLQAAHQEHMARYVDRIKAVSPRNPGREASEDVPLPIRGLNTRRGR